jgi:ribonuclease HI
MPKSYYAVARGRTPGIYATWDECKAMTTGFAGARYKKFTNLKEAEEFVGVPVVAAPVVAAPVLPVPPAPEQVTTTTGAEMFVYTDGACTNNGKPTARAGYGVYFPFDPARNVSQPLAPTDPQTNNFAELSAIIRALELTHGQYTIVTDSKYGILCCTTYGAKCHKSGWTRKAKRSGRLVDGVDHVKDMPNKELVKKAYGLCLEYTPRFKYIRGHTGLEDEHSRGNVEADALATAAAAAAQCDVDLT